MSKSDDVLYTMQILEMMDQGYMLVRESTRVCWSYNGKIVDRLRAGEYDAVSQLEGAGLIPQNVKL